MKVIDLPIDKIIPYERNPRINDISVPKVMESIREYGFRQPIVVDESMVIVAGHTRYEAACRLGLESIPIHIADGLSAEQVAAYRLADNRSADDSSWDDELLALEFSDLTDAGFDLGLTLFDPDEIGQVLAFGNATKTGNTDEDETPEPPAEPISALGDIWLLGKHRLICGDSTDADAVGLLMAGKTAQLLHADPPYGMGKEKDGVLNDNKYADKLDAFQMEWWQACRTFIDDNASAYIWGNAKDLWRLWYQGDLESSERLTMRQQIIWNKGHGQGMTADSFRMYPTATEHCLFFMLGEQGFNNNSDNYWEGWEPIRAYLDGERKKMGWSDRFVANFMGVSSRLPEHWFTKSQWMFPTKERYKSLQAEAKGNAFKREHDELKREHDELKREFYATRAYFDNTHDSMTDVWEFQRVIGDDRCGHATPKPAAMMARIMKSSLAPGDACLEPFGGSGSTLIGAEMTGRQCFIIELDERYCDVIVRRWQDFTGQTATRESDGVLFDVANSEAA